MPKSIAGKILACASGFRPIASIALKPIKPIAIAGLRIRTKRRDAVMAYLKQQEIGCEVYYPVPLPLLPCFKDLGHTAGEFPISEAASNETLALPIYPELTPEMIQSVASAVLAA